MIGMLLTAVSAAICLWALIRFGDEDKDWLKFQVFEAEMRRNPTAALESALAGAQSSYEMSRISERSKTGYQTVAVLVLVLGGLLYVTAGYKIEIQMTVALGLLLLVGGVLRLGIFLVRRSRGKMTA
jgi:hypothetical protein